MQATVLSQAGARLALQERADPDPGPGEVRLGVLACAVCRTDLHVANLTRDDAREFLAAAASTPLFVAAQSHSLSQANEALAICGLAGSSARP